MAVSVWSFPNITGKEVAITGTLPILRREMIAIIKTCGGTYHEGVAKSTDTLLVGKLPFSGTRKLTRAMKLQENGGKIVIVNGAVLLRNIIEKECKQSSKLYNFSPENVQISEHQFRRSP